jgi:hypothetical protein
MFYYERKHLLVTAGSYGVKVGARTAGTSPRLSPLRTCTPT